MRKVLVLILLAGFLGGCATSPYSMNRKGNKIEVTKPEAAEFVVDKDYEYLGHEKKYNADVFVFSKGLRDHITVGTIYNPLWDVDSEGVRKQKNKTRYVIVSNRDFDIGYHFYKSVLKVSNSSEYPSKKSSLIRVVGLMLHNGHWFGASYSEGIEIEENKVDDWGEYSDLSAKQKEYIENFDQRMREKIDFERALATY